MSKREAMDMRDQLDDACMFNERIFEPRFVTIPEVEGLVRDLRGMKDGESDGLGDLCQRSIDMITLLSAQKVVRGTIRGGVLDLSEVSAGVEVDIRDYDCEGLSDPNILKEDASGTHFQAG
jgi:hypothetical protein